MNKKLSLKRINDLTQLKIYLNEPGEENDKIFFRQLIEHSNQLIQKIKESFPLRLSKFFSLQKKYPKIKSQLDKAAAFYVLCHATWSDNFLIGSMAPGHPNFTMESINSLKKLSERLNSGMIG